MKRGPRGYGDGHYRRIAFAYLDLLNGGMRRGILAALAEAEGQRLGHDVPIETIRTWVNQARKRQFLTPGEPGRATANAGPRLYETGDSR